MDQIAGRQKLVYETDDKIVEAPLLGVLYTPDNVHGRAIEIERIEQFDSSLRNQPEFERTLIPLTVTEAIKLIEHLTIAINCVLAADENYMEPESKGGLT